MASTTTNTGSWTRRRARGAAPLVLLCLALLPMFGASSAAATEGRPTAPPPPHRQTTHPVTNATYAIGLSATGFLLPFVQGALEVLVEAGVVVTRDTPVAGSSGGALLALAACSGAPAEATHAALETLAERCLPRACTFTQDDAVREAIGRIIDAGEEAKEEEEVDDGGGATDPRPKPDPSRRDSSPSSAVVRRCRGKAFAAISVAFGRGGGLLAELRRCAAAAGAKSSYSSPPRLVAALVPAPAACAARALRAWWWRPALWVVGDWRDRGDLADGVAASCFFPALSSAWRPWASLRGRTRLLDGVFASPLPLPPAPPPSTPSGNGGDDGAAPRRPVRVSAVPLGTSAAPFSEPILEAEIAPFLRVGGEGAPAGLPEASRWRRFLVLVPSAAERAAMRELGRREAFAWWAEEVAAAAARGTGAEEEEEEEEGRGEAGEAVAAS